MTQRNDRPGRSPGLLVITLAEVGQTQPVVGWTDIEFGGVEPEQHFVDLVVEIAERHRPL